MTLAVLVSLLLVINTGFMFIIGLNNEGSVGERVINSVTGNANQLAIFDRGVLETPILQKKTATKLSTPSETIPAPKENIEIVKGTNGFEMIVNYDKMTITVDGKEMPIIVDKPEVFSEGKEITSNGGSNILNKASSSWIHIPYNRFNIYVDSDYYAANTAELNNYFNEFEERYLMLESQTGWSSEKFYGTKLQMYVNSTQFCSEGYAHPGTAYVKLYYNLSDHSVCQLPTYNEGVPDYNNPGELGDQWTYMRTPLHEALHAINPYTIFSRSWITEGFSKYYEFNVLAEKGDINQETADYYIYQGGAGYNWAGYVANDYHDTTPYNREIQDSAGYHITAWMFSMMRDNHALDWNEFYTIMADNDESLDKSYSLGNYFVDSHVIDLFARASNLGTFDNAKPVWRYDGPAGPGWGVRNWTNLSWYADLTPILEASKINPLPGESVILSATVYNNGDTNANNFSVRFYEGTNLINEQFVSVPSHSNVLVSTSLIRGEGSYTIKAVVDEPNIKIETDETNNQFSIVLNFFPICGDADGNLKVDILDVTRMINVMYKNTSYYACLSPYLNCADLDGSGVIDLLDITHIINFLYKHGPAPVCGFGVEGSTPSEQGEVTMTYEELQQYLASAMAGAW